MIFLLKYHSLNNKQIEKFIVKYSSRSKNLDDERKKVLAHYCKQNVPEINRILRNNKRQSENTIRYINYLDSILSNNIGKNLVLYRIVNTNIFEDKVYHEKAYMSTSLMYNGIKNIHNGEYILKILAPRICKGFYVDYISERCGEYEMLLSRDIELKKLLTINEKNRILILCKVISC